MSKEYIDRELLENAFEDENKNGNFVFTANWIMEIVDNLPTADVVPKSEVEKIFEEIAKMVYSKIPDKILPVTFREMSRQLDYNDGLNFGSRNAYFDTLKIIAELKKKYTE